MHSKKRSRLAQSRINDLVYIKYNRALKRRYNLRDTIDPISLKDVDDSNEWLIGRIEEDEVEEFAEDDLVFNDDILTWGNVARAFGVKEERFNFRSRMGPLGQVQVLVHNMLLMMEMKRMRKMMRATNLVMKMMMVPCLMRMMMIM